MNVKKDDSEDVEKNTQNILDLEGGDDIIYTYQGVHARRVRFRLPVKKTDTAPDALEKEYTFVTNLDPVLYPIQTIKVLYHQRYNALILRSFIKY